MAAPIVVCLAEGATRLELRQRQFNENGVESSEAVLVITSRNQLKALQNDLAVAEEAVLLDG